MMRKFLFAMAFSTVFFSSSLAAAEKMDFDLKTTQDLIDLCSVSQGQPYSIEAIHFCSGFIDGAVEYHDAIVGPNIKRVICYPKEATRDDAILVLTAWGKSHGKDAQLMKDRAVNGLMKALQEKWPCKT